MKKKSNNFMPKVDPYLEGFMGKLLDRLTSLEKKVDVVISKVSQKTSGDNQPQAQSQPQPPRRDKPLYEAICADCSQICEVPFRPTENRPVYCKACWAKRRDKNHGMPVFTPVSLPPRPVSKLGLPQTPAVVVEAPAAKKVKKPAPSKSPKKAKKKK